MKALVYKNTPPAVGTTVAVTRVSPQECYVSRRNYRTRGYDYVLETVKPLPFMGTVKAVAPSPESDGHRVAVLLELTPGQQVTGVKTLDGYAAYICEAEATVTDWAEGRGRTVFFLGAGDYRWMPVPRMGCGASQM